MSGAGWLFAVLVVAVVAAPFLWWIVPERQMRRLRTRHEAAIASGTMKDIEIEKLGDDYRKTVTQAIGGATLLLSATVAFAQLQEAGNALSLYQQFSKGFELVASDNPTQRVGGVHALQGLARASPQNYPMVVLALTSLIQSRRGNGGSAVEPGCRDYQRPPSKTVTEDIQAALDVLRTRPLKPAATIDLSTANLSMADLPGIDLSRARLAYVDLSGANLRGANLRGADLRCANLHNADLSGAELSEANLFRAELHGVTVDARTDLHNACLGEVDMMATDLRPAKNLDTATITPKGSPPPPGTC